MTHEPPTDSPRPDSPADEMFPFGRLNGALSRRRFVALAGLGAAAAALIGCENGKQGLVTDLPSAPPVRPFSPYNPPPAFPPTQPPVAPPVRETYGIIPRAAWAKAGPDLKRVDRMNGVNIITFHHSGDPKPFSTVDYAETAKHLEYVREYHRSRNFQDIGYHFAIDRAGRVWQLRPLLYQGQHVRYNNEHNIGVVVLGNFEIQQPSQAQKDKIRQFGTLLRKQYGLAAAKIKTHQEIVSTECPGRGMQPYMVQIRKQNLI